MRLRLLGAAQGWRSLLIATLLYNSVCAKKDAPKVTSNKFEHPPSEMSYFDDSDVLLFQDYHDDMVYRSPDAGESWAKLADIPAGKAWTLVMHPFDSKRAYILTKSTTHWKTSDRGESWTEFFTDCQPNIFMYNPMAFHAGDPDRIILNGQDCSGSLFCEDLAVYTTDGFKTDAKFLRSDTSSCYWAKSTALFTTGQKDLDANRVLCVTKGKYSPWKKDYRLLISDNFFVTNGGAIQEFEPELEQSRTVTGVANMAVVKKYLLAAAMAEGTDEMALYVSDDTIKWHRAIFPHDHKLVEEAYTVLESTNYSIQIDVMTTRPMNAMGVLLSSNSNGTYFTRNIEHTNRNHAGNVDFEKIAGIQGIVLVNVVDNWEEVEKSVLTAKKVKSMISFDDGRRWQELKVGDASLHLHSVVDASNSGRIFSSPAPGLVMGVGNTGDELKDYEEGDLYVSDNAGVTWTKALDGPHKYEFGDQGSVLVAIEDKVTQKISYSLNHGKTWKEVDLPDKVAPYVLTTTSDSTSLKFLLISSYVDKDKNDEYFVMSIDFDDLHEGQCKESDIEKWYARVDADGKGTCLMGHKQFYMRRKADADCFLKKEWQDPEVQSEACECTIKDFECDFNFIRSEDRKECIQAGDMVVPEGSCKNPGDSFKASSGWRKIPGNDCKRTEGEQVDDPVERKCDEAVGPPASGKISHTQEVLPGKQIYNKFYLERTELSTGDDETVIVQTDKGVYLSHDHGKTWKPILEQETIKYIIPHPHFNDVVYFLTAKDKVYYSMDRGDDIQKFGADVPSDPDPDYKVWPMAFHPKHKDWIIWTGRTCNKEECHFISSVTTDRGDNWKTLERYVKKCEFIFQDDNKFEKQKRDDKLIYCKVKTRESTSNDDNPWQLVASNDFFDERVTRFDDIVDFATMAEFIIVAAKDDKQDLKVDASIDGEVFAEALFPSNFRVPHQHAYTVLDSSTHSIFLHVTVDNSRQFEYGTIIKSNSNGTSYVLSLNAVNRDEYGYVDFEKMSGLEGVALVNVVANLDSVQKDGGKKLKTKITHNDGAEWLLLNPPAKDAQGENMDCSGPTEQCSLHIHGYTERLDKSHTFSSPTAVGLMLGVGNVGEYLGPYDKADTYITTDAGINWKQISKGTHMWEFGDQGSIIVLVKDTEETNVILYSLNEGDTWSEYQFAEQKLKILDISTLPNDNSRNFLLWTYSSDGLKTINLDMTGLTDRQCKLDENGENEDYYLWSPRHPTQDNDCLFGHVAQYHRKKTAAQCYNGRKIQHLHNIARDCECTRRDFECDYNFQNLVDGTCSLVEGLAPLDPLQVCRENPDAIEYYDTTGYRRIPLSTCKGGKELELTSKVSPCPGKEDLFWKKRGISGVAIFFAILVPISAAAATGWWVWRNWGGKFGQIRLGEQSMFDDQAPYIKYPVMAISAVAALVLALPVVVGSIWGAVSKLLGRSRTTRYTTRSSFARSDYAVVDEDEGELLGDESDEEV